LLDPAIIEKATATVVDVEQEMALDALKVAKLKHPRVSSHETLAPRERAYLVGIGRFGDVFEVEDSLNELAQLCDTAGLEVIGSTYQNISTVNSSYLIGRGKLAELKETRDATKADVVVFDVELSPTHQREIEEALKVKIMDRTGIILDIFARRARTHEGRLQVELAQLEYRLPRLTRMWTHLGRQAATGSAGGMGVGLRGPGETQLEIDRRRSNSRISHLKEQLKHVKMHRDLYRQRRKAEGMPVVALVGYTNAGKSTLLNKLSNAGVLAENKLFATLDPTTRRLRLPSGREVLLTDTVGFIQRLPTSLVEAFRSTLEEVNEADLLVHVLDFTHANAQEQSETVEEVLKELGVGEKPRLVALNKVDLMVDASNYEAADGDSSSISQQISTELELPADYVAISAEKDIGLDLLLARIEQALDKNMVAVSLNIPYAQGDLVSLFHQKGLIEQKEQQDTGTFIKGRIPVQYAPLFQPYQQKQAS
jgi:GTP-binding protein HflX